MVYWPKARPAVEAMQEQTHIERLSDRIQGRVPPSVDGIDDGAADATGSARLIAGRYQLGPRLGRGRLGEIFEALDLADRDLGVERRKAIQLLTPAAVSDPGFVQRLGRAYEALRTASHPNLVNVLDVGRDGQRHYLVMELLGGTSLRTVLDDAGVLPLEEALPVIGAVGNALAYLHVKGVVHGNVRPEQVFVTFEYQVKLLDVVPLPLPQTSAEISDDIFALACLAYTLLAGRHPFNECSAREALRTGMRPAPIATLPATKWASLERGLGLALSSKDRPASVTELMVDLGLEGSERLRAETELAPGPELRAATERRAGTERHAGSESSAGGEYRAEPEFQAWHEPELEPAPLPIVRPEYVPQNQLHGRARDSSTRRPLILLVLAAVLVGATFLAHDRLRNATADLFALAAPEIPASVPPTEAPTEPPVATSSVDSSGELGALAPSVDAPESEPPPTSSVESSPPVIASEPEPVAGAEIAVVPPEGSAPAASEPTASPAASDGEASLGFATSVVAATELDPAARVVLERSGNASSSETFVWWTTNGTALADEDYADLGERTETLRPGELERTLLVPLIQDTVPESSETFFVHVGRYEQSRRHLALISSVRVEIRAD
jgi:hypothetical protein